MPHRDIVPLAAVGSVQNAATVEVVPGTLGEVGTHSGGLLVQDGRHQQSVSHHPLLGNVARGVVGWEGEEQRPRNRAPVGVRVKESSVEVGQQPVARCQNLPCNY